jgi:hypothetical protein
MSRVLYRPRARRDGGPPDQYKLLTQLNYVMTLDTRNRTQSALFLGPRTRTHEAWRHVPLVLSLDAKPTSVLFGYLHKLKLYAMTHDTSPVPVPLHAAWLGGVQDLPGML